MIESLIRQAVIAGAKGLTLWPTPDGQWQASLKNQDGGFRVRASDDPVTAVLEALTPRQTTDDKGIFG